MTKKKPVRILHFSSTNRDVGCGVARYQESYVAAMADSPIVENKFFEVSPYDLRPMDQEGVEKVMEQLEKELADYDILHIQHEFAWYWHNQFIRIMETGKAAGKKVIVTLHLSPGNVPELAPVRLGGFSPRSVMRYLRQLRRHRRMMQEQVEPMRQADLLIVHTEVTAKCLESLGVDPQRIKKISHPIYEVSTPPPSQEIAQHLNKQPGDIVFAITGYLHRYKNITEAVCALKFLPVNYKLALIGGIKSDSDDVPYENRITDLVDSIGVADRVYITGFVPDDRRLDALIRECDVCVYPYDRTYYSNASSGALSLAFSNAKPVVAYPTEGIKEAAADADGAIVLCQTFAYYELARELQRIDYKKQSELSKAYAKKLAWPKMTEELVRVYETVARA